MKGTFGITLAALSSAIMCCKYRVGEPALPVRLYRGQSALSLPCSKCYHRMDYHLRDGIALEVLLE